MIGKLRGIIDEINEHHLILDVNGVGYVVFCSAATLRAMPTEGLAAKLIIETHVREDHIHLYGFLTEAERSWFRLLLTVKGVGTKVALAILSALNAEQLAIAIASQDKAAFKPVAGVGPKLAERVLIELKDKDSVFPAASILPMPAHTGSVATPETTPHTAAVRDAVSALTNLGYNRSEAYAAVARLASKQNNPTVESLIRETLQELAT
jgi:holliday junction DNA helicase RuvA